MASEDTNLFPLLREEVKCIICLEQLKKPRLLICFHSFCEKCLETYKEEKSTAGKMACPVCDEETILTDAGILGLRQDFRAITLMERQEKEKPKHQKKTKVTKLCEGCGSINSDLASSFFDCAQCKQVLCTECANRHEHLMCTDDSRSTSVAETGFENDYEQDKRIFCEKHGGIKRDLFCTFCLIPVCCECSVIDHRREDNHKCVPVQDFVPMMREEIQSRLPRLAQVCKQCADIIPLIKSAEDLAKKQRDLLDKQLKHDIDQYTNCIKTDLSVKNVKFFELRIQTLGQWQKIIEERAESIEKIRLKTEGALEQSEKSNVLAALYKGLLKSLDSLLSGRPENYILKTMGIIMKARQLHFRLAEDEFLIGTQLFTRREVCERRTINIHGDIRAITFTHDGRVAVSTSLSGPQTSETKTRYFTESGKSYYPTCKKLYEQTEYSAIEQTTASSNVATKFGIEIRLASYSGSAVASLSDLRFALDKRSSSHLQAHDDVFYVSQLPGPISCMATDLKGNIFCSVPIYRTIYVVRANGPQTKSISTGVLTPQEIAVCPRSPDQIVFTHHSSKVSVTDWDGKLLRTITRPEWKGVAIGCDNERLLYVLWKNEAGLRTLQRFYLNGELLDTLFEGETHWSPKLLLAVSPRGTAAVVTNTGQNGKVMLISTRREFTGDETSLPK